MTLVVMRGFITTPSWLGLGADAPTDRWNGGEL
jgi:hypothetical protein